MTLQKALILALSLLFYPAQDAPCTSFSLSDDSYPVEQLFGESWHYTGLPIPTFSEPIEPTDLFLDASAQKSPDWDRFDIPLLPTFPSQCTHISTQLTPSPRPDKRGDLPGLVRVRYEPTTRQNGRKFLAADVSKIAYGESLRLLAHGNHADLEIAQHNFLMCYRFSTSHRWTGCFQLAKTHHKRGDKHEARNYLQRIVESTTCPSKTKQKAQKFLERRFRSHS